MTASYVGEGLSDPRKRPSGPESRRRRLSGSKDPDLQAKKMTVGRVGEGLQTLAGDRRNPKPPTYNRGEAG